MLWRFVLLLSGSCERAEHYFTSRGGNKLLLTAVSLSAGIHCYGVLSRQSRLYLSQNLTSLQQEALTGTEA